MAFSPDGSLVALCAWQMTAQDPPVRPKRKHVGPVAVGHFEDRFVRTDAGWRFVSRRLQVAFRDPDVPASTGAIS